MTGKIPQRRDDLRQARSQRGPQGRTLGAIGKGGDGPSPLGFDIAWNNVCKKSPNLLATLFPLPALCLKQCRRWVQPWAGTGGFPGAIRPKKECIKSCETCFAKNVLNFVIRVQEWHEFVTPKFYGPLAIWPWLKISPQTSLNVIYCLIITAWQWLMS